MAANSPIVLPFGISFEDWGKRLIETFPDLNIPLPPDQKYWWDWGRFLMNIPEFYQAPVPDKKIYPKEEEWVEWAIFFIQVVQP
jgi:hypothetical protein